MKKRFIACIVACAMLLMGTGYAYWTNTIDLTASVDTAELDVRFIDADASFSFDDWPEVLSRDLLTNATAGGADISIDGATSIGISVNEMYPGYAQKFKVSVDNFGDLAAKLGQIKTTFIDDNDEATAGLDQMLGMNIFAEVNDKVYGWFGGSWVEWNEVVDLPEGTAGDFKISNVGFYRFANLDTITNYPQTNKEFLYLDTDIDTRMDFYIIIGMDPDASGAYTSGSSFAAPLAGGAAHPADANTEDKQVGLKLEFVWDQYNAQ